MLPLPCMLVCRFLFAQNRTRDRGCSKHPVFPAPSEQAGGKLLANLGRNAPRDRKVIFQLSSPAQAGDPVFETEVIESRGLGVLDPRLRGDDSGVRCYLHVIASAAKQSMAPLVEAWVASSLQRKIA